jgi:hypothetical protein
LHAISAGALPPYTIDERELRKTTPIRSDTARTPTPMKLIEPLIDDLVLDDENPRLPESLVDRSQIGLLKWMANEYNTVEVARSISAHGYFDSEPVIAIRTRKKLTVVEGNRRLTAVKLLLDTKLRQSLQLDDAEEWEELANAAELENRIPVRVAKSRREVAPVIGYRHIAGIEPWDPWAKARFIAREIEKERQSFGRVAVIVGERESEVRAHYRNYRVAIDAEKVLRVPASRVKQQFGFFTRAMNSVGLREHIGAPAPSEVKPRKRVLRKRKKKEVAEVFSWLFGDDQFEPVIKDSRQISSLGEVVASPGALKVLRRSRSLEDAMMASGGVHERLLKRLRASIQALQQAELDIENFRSDSEVIEALHECNEVLSRLRSA